jgi:cysteine desulfurase
MDIPVEHAQGAVRFSLGHESTEADIRYVVDTLKTQVARIREMSPLFDDIQEQEINQKQV